MAEKTKTIFKFSFNENLFVEFSANLDYGLSIIGLDNVVIEETLNTASPMLTLRFLDVAGEQLNRFFINPITEFRLSYGTKDTNNFTSYFKYSSSKTENIAAGRTDRLATNLSFISNNWEKLLKDNYSRAWNNKRISDVVGEIADECKYTKDIEQTKGLDTFIQPYWDNYKFIRWLSSVAINERDISGYRYGITLDNRLLFRSLNSLYSQKPKKTFILMDKEITDEKNNTSHFKAFLVKNDYIYKLSGGGFGLKYMWFDFNTKEFKQGESKVSLSKSKQLSDYYVIASDHENSPNILYNGSNKFTPNMTESTVLNSSNDNQTAAISIDGDMNLHIGDIINIVIPSNNLRKNEIIDSYYSGYWIIKRISHVITWKEGKLVSNLVLTRPGVDGDIKGLVKSSVGKNIV